MALDNKLLEYRLLTNDSVVGNISITRCSNKLSALKDKPISSTTVDSFLREVALYRLDIDKVIRNCDVLSELQGNEYADLEIQIQEEISKVKNSINALQSELTQHQAIRKHRVECEQLSVSVNKHASKSSLKRKISKISNGYLASQELLDHFNVEITTRAKQFEDLLQCITILQTSSDLSREMIVDAADGEEEDLDEGNNDRGNRETEEVVKQNNNDEYDETCENDGLVESEDINSNNNGDGEGEEVINFTNENITLQTKDEMTN